MRKGLAALCGAAVVWAATARDSPRKKLIEFGWDEPSAAFMKGHIEEMEKTPFDGCVYHVDFKSEKGESSFAWQTFGKRAFSESELQGSIDALRTTRFTSFRSNLLRFNATPGDVDWYDDFSAITTNARLAARVAKLGRSAGILFDTEPYEGPLWDYTRQKNPGKRSFADYSAQARRRGREVMEAFEQGYPGLTVFLTFGHSYVRWQIPRYQKPHAEVTFGLLAPFIDGMIEGAREAQIVDGHERSYWFKDAAMFREASALMREGVRPIVHDFERYKRVMSFGFGIWMDYDWRHEGWEVADFKKNYFEPEEFYASVRTAFELADEYVWVYTEQPRWWSPEGGPVKLPAAYHDALRRAKRDGAGPVRRPR